jgi:hypothetical protein
MSIRIKDIYQTHPKEVARFYERQIDMIRSFSVLEMKCGTVYVETSRIDDDGTETTEVLFSTDKKVFKIVSRFRTGGDHHYMRPYARDSELPLYSAVKLA